MKACALCFEDLDFEAGKISIYKTLYYRGTDSGERRVKEIGPLRRKFHKDITNVARSERGVAESINVSKSD